MLKGRPLKTRLKGMLLLFSLLPCCGLGLALTGMSWRSYLKNLGKENQAVLTALRNDVQVMESQAESLVNTLASDSTVLSLLTPSEGLADGMMHSSGVQRELMIVKASLSVFDANFVLIYLDDAQVGALVHRSVCQSLPKRSCLCRLSFRRPGRTMARAGGSAAEGSLQAERIRGMEEHICLTARFIPLPENWWASSVWGSTFADC